MSFRTVRLPRAMRVVFPREDQTLAEGLRAPGSLIVAETFGVVRGYLLLRLDSGHNSAWVSDMGVGRAWRRQGIGSALLAQAYGYAQVSVVRRLTVETQSKNYPGICFCQKHGLVFSGFNDRYYP